MKITARVVTAVLLVSFCSTLQASKFGSVEPIANPDVIDTTLLRDQSLRVREAFATRLLQCGIVRQVEDALSSTGAITTINDLNTHFAVGAGGFAGSTNPSFVYTVIDDGPNAASTDDVKVLDRQPGLRAVAGKRLSARCGRSLQLRLSRELRRAEFRRAAPDRGLGGALQDGRSDRSRALRDRHERLHAVRPRLSLAAVRRARRAVHRGLRGGGRESSASSTRRSSTGRRHCSREAPPSRATTGS